MTLRQVEATFDDGNLDTVLATLDSLEVGDIHVSPTNDHNQRLVKVLTDTQNVQIVTDRLQTVLGGGDKWRLVILPVEATMPALTTGSTSTPSREELYQDVAHNATLDTDFLVLTTLAVIVAWIGLNEANIAVIIGAMVIAPLLGPNLALSLGAALGDRTLIRRALTANSAGVGLTLALACLIGYAWVPDVTSVEILARTEVGIGDVGLALASGAAAALSLSKGASSTLVGVMVSISLMPPAVVAGMMLGAQNWTLAQGALFLLVANVVCLNVASQLVLVWKGVRPRTWHERKLASTSVRDNLIVWTILLGLVATLLWIETT